MNKYAFICKNNLNIMDLYLLFVCFYLFFFIFDEVIFIYYIMEKEMVIIATDKKTLKEVLTEMFFEKTRQIELPDFEKDRISKAQAAKLVGISIPTLCKQVDLGKFREYSIGKRKYFLRSEIIESLRGIK